MPSALRTLNPRVADILAITLIAVAALHTFAWVFAPEITFYEDDWTWLRSAVFVPWTSFLSMWTVLPASLFHDRPVENAIVKLLYQLFGLEHTGYAAATLAIHIGNAVLLYLLGVELLKTRFYAMVAAVLFVIDYNVAYPVWWVATVADSASLFFSLCAFLAFTSPRRAYAVAGSVVFYLLAVKAKESALPLPMLLVAYHFLDHVASRQWSDIKNALRATVVAAWPLLATFAVFTAFDIYYYIAAKKAGMIGYGPYVPQFDLPTLIDGTRIYLRYIAFDLLSLNQALIGFGVLTAIAIASFNRPAIVGAIGFFVSLGMVLFIPNTREAYYAYPACAYVALMLAALIARADDWLSERLGAAVDFAAKALVLATVVWFTHYVYGLGLIRNYVFHTMPDTAKALQSLQSAVTHVDEHTMTVVTGLPGGAHLFSHAPCMVMSVVFKVWDYPCKIDGTEAELTAFYERSPPPKLLLHYDQGVVARRAQEP